jgi:hypothetical protein
MPDPVVSHVFREFLARFAVSTTLRTTRDNGCPHFGADCARVRLAALGGYAAMHDQPHERRASL